MTYLPNIPQPTDNLSVSQGNIQGNFAQSNTLFSIDHLPFTDASDEQGYHLLLHQGAGLANPVSGPTFRTKTLDNGTLDNFPGSISKVNQLFPANYTPVYMAGNGPTDTQLFTKTGNGTVFQLTGNQISAQGWAWIGGLLLQWGQVTGLSGSWPTTQQTVTFKTRGASNIQFPNNCYNVVTNFIGPTSSSTGEVIINSINATTFVWQFTGSASAAFAGFYWSAIGN